MWLPLLLPQTASTRLLTKCAATIQSAKRVFGLVIDFGTSQSPKSTRPLTTYWCPSRPGHQALRNNFASSLLLRTWLPYDWTPRSEAYFVFPLAQGTPGKQCGLAATGVYQPSLRSPWLAAIDLSRDITVTVQCTIATTDTVQPVAGIRPDDELRNGTLIPMLHRWQQSSTSATAGAQGIVGNTGGVGDDENAKSLLRIILLQIDTMEPIGLWRQDASHGDGYRQPVVDTADQGLPEKIENRVDSVSCTVLEHITQIHGDQIIFIIVVDDDPGPSRIIPVLADNDLPASGRVAGFPKIVATQITDLRLGRTRDAMQHCRILYIQAVPMTRNPQVFIQVVVLQQRGLFCNAASVTHTGTASIVRIAQIVPDQQVSDRLIASHQAVVFFLAVARIRSPGQKPDIVLYAEIVDGALFCIDMDARTKTKKDDVIGQAFHAAAILRVDGMTMPATWSRPAIVVDDAAVYLGIFAVASLVPRIDATGIVMGNEVDDFVVFSIDIDTSSERDIGGAGAVFLRLAFYITAAHFQAEILHPGTIDAQS